MKDGVVESAAKAYLNGKIAGFGSIRRIEFNSKLRTALVEVELKGESSPITVKIGSYCVSDREGQKFLTVHDVQSSRDWIGLAVDQYIAGREFKIPDVFGSML